MSQFSSFSLTCTDVRIRIIPLESHARFEVFTAVKIQVESLMVL